MSEIHTLYAMPHSLYSGRARSYLLKAGIPFRELSTGHESFKADVLPQAELPTIPTLVTPSGEVIRDGAAIIEYFESKGGRPSQPPGTRQRLVSSFLDVVGTDGLLRPAMHYRWNFPEENLNFLRYHFLHSQRLSPAREDKTDHMMDRMRHAGRLFGVEEDSVAMIEGLYLEFLDALDAHLARYPYLLGGRPCLGDFGLIAPLYAHLGRDPHPSRIMQTRATHVFRWVERMNRADADTPEFFESPLDFLPDDEIPESLIRVLSVVACDFIPETRAAAAHINAWLADAPPEAGTGASGRLGAAVGQAEFEVRGTAIRALAQPYRFYLLQRLQDDYDQLSTGERKSADRLFAACDLGELPELRLTRRLERVGNLEAWT